MSHYKLGLLAFLFGCCQTQHNTNFKYFTVDIYEVVRVTKEQDQVMAEQNQLISELETLLENNRTMSGQSSTNEINLLNSSITARLAIVDENEENLKSLNITLNDQMETMEIYKNKMTALNVSVAAEKQTIDAEQQAIDEIANRIHSLDQSVHKYTNISSQILFV